MRVLTDFGDLALLLPLSGVICAWLLSHHPRRVAGSWVVALGSCIVITALLKIYLYAYPRAPDFISPSGHSSLSVLNYGAISLVIAAERKGWLRALSIATAVAFVAAIAGSRLWLSTHSVPEIALGLLIGTATLTLFANQYLRFRKQGTQLRLFVLSVIIAITFLHGQELGAETFLHAISRHFRYLQCVS
jgi:membrane-associated phospholipid phosphatase